MGRKKVPENEIKENTKIRIRSDYKKKAREMGLNLSQVMENALLEIFKKKKIARWAAAAVHCS